MTDPRKLLKNDDNAKDSKDQTINWTEAKLDIGREDLEKIWTNTYNVALRAIIERVVINSEPKDATRLMSIYMPLIFKACDLAIQEYTKYLKANKPMILDCLEEYNRLNES